MGNLLLLSQSVCILQDYLGVLLLQFFDQIVRILLALVSQQACKSLLLIFNLIAAF